MTVSDLNFPLSVNDESYEATVSLSPLPQPVEAEPTILQLPVAQQAITPEMIRASHWPSVHSLPPTRSMSSATTATRSSPVRLTLCPLTALP